MSIATALRRGAFVDGAAEPIEDDVLTITDPATGAHVGDVILGACPGPLPDDA